MKHVLLATACLIFSGCVSVNSVPTAPDTAAKPAAYDMPHVKRPNLIVADMERSLAIYRDILGFSPGGISESSLDSFSYPVFNFPPKARMRYTYLGEPGEDRVFGLTEVKNIALPRPPSEPFVYATVIGITDLEAKFAKLEAMGLKVTESKTAEGAEFRFIEQAFVDPDGHLIVCYEQLPSE